MSWLWNRGGENKHLARIEAIEKAIEGLESRQKLVRSEWEEVLDRVNRVMGRLNARIRKTGASEAPESDDQDDSRGAPPPPVGLEHTQLYTP